MNVTALLERLPAHLQERCRLVQGDEPGLDRMDVQSGGMILYWMCTAMRCDENPALDVAACLAKELRLPLLVYQGLSQGYAYASDRFHTFILQGVCDLQQDMEQRGISYVFHLERPGHEGDHLRQLVRRSVVTVAEDMPTHAPKQYLKLVKRTTRANIVAVNTACVVSPRLVGKAYDRAFEYRNSTRDLYAERVSRAWPEIDHSVGRPDPSIVNWQTTVVKEAEIADLVASCDVDHCVAPVVDTRGGVVAGYQRWESFKHNGLEGYAKTRNNPLDSSTSRMSAYLHFGMVSPMRLAREAAGFDQQGAEKYLDELLIWRELAYCFCHYREDCERWSALPEWARRTLEDHQGDTREHLYTWEQLARAQTDDDLWNAAQKSLLIHGELHNNVRMTWGKAIANWTQTPQRALEWMIDLNHRYALDGRDPASYGGILWCLGQFDRPFSPEQPIFGTVRTRPTETHARRLDVPKYRKRTSTTRAYPVPQIAVIGAGFSGCMAARTLQDHGCRVQVFEKSRGVSGRMSTRRTEFGCFDHGAQYFTARDLRFRRYVAAWKEQGVVAPWQGEIVAFDQPKVASPTSDQERLVGVPGMNAIAKQIAADLNVQSNVRVESVCRKGKRYLIVDDQGNELGEFDRLIVSVPPQQAADILTEFESLQPSLLQVEMNPCWATLCRLPATLDVTWSGAFVNLGKPCPLRWIARNQTKPGRTESHEHLVIHADSNWSRDHLDVPPDEIAKEMLASFWDVTGLEPTEPDLLCSHRWRYSIPDNPSSDRCLVTDDRTIAVCGDWAGGPRVEGAFLSGCAAAGRILSTLSAQRSGESEQLKLF